MIKPKTCFCQTHTHVAYSTVRKFILWQAKLSNFSKLVMSLIRIKLHSL